MDVRLSDIKVLIWDFDGTLYKQIPGLWDSISESEYRVIMQHKRWSREKAMDEFKKIHTVVTPSGTKTVSLITGLSVTQAAIETSKLTKYEDFLKPDSKLTDVFELLKKFTHFMLVNGSKYSVTKGLSLLALPALYFQEIVTSEAMGETKPSAIGFQYILNKTGLQPEQHLMIGDREAVDLVPAKSLGMKTCLVWSDTPSVVADVTLPTVYALTDVLG